MAGELTPRLTQRQGLAPERCGHGALSMDQSHYAWPQTRQYRSRSSRRRPSPAQIRGRERQPLPCRLVPAVASRDRADACVMAQSESPAWRQVACADHLPVVGVQDPGGPPGPTPRLDSEPTIGQLAQQLPDLLAVAAQHRLMWPRIGHQLQQPHRWGVDRKGIDQLDRHARRGSAARRSAGSAERAGHDAGDRVVPSRASGPWASWWPALTGGGRPRPGHWCLLPAWACRMR